MACLGLVFNGQSSGVRVINRPAAVPMRGVSQRVFPCKLDAVHEQYHKS